MNKIFCKKSDNRHEFYLFVGGTEYYLFDQSFRRGVDDFFRNGVIIDKALNHGIGRWDYAIHQTMDKLKMYIKYIESQNDITVLKNTSKKMRAVA